MIAKPCSRGKLSDRRIYRSQTRLASSFTTWVNHPIPKTNTLYRINEQYSGTLYFFPVALACWKATETLWLLLNIFSTAHLQ